MDLSVRLENLRDTCKECWKSVKKISNDVQLAEKLSKRILLEKHAQHIAVTCPDILIDLLNRLKLEHAQDEALGCVLASLKSTDVEYWAEDYFSKHGASFLDRFIGAEKEVLANGEPAAKKPKKSDSHDDVRVLRAATVLLGRNPEFYGSLWDFSFASRILSRRSRGSDARLKWYAAHCLAHVNQMSSEDLDTVLSMHFTTQEVDAFRKEDFDSSLEIENKQLVQRIVLSKPCDTVDIEGVTIYADSSSVPPQEEDSVVYTPSFRQCLREVASTVVSNKAVLVTGAVGVGKTKLIEHLANKTRNRLFKVQLGNHVDSKTLVGSYCCTDIAGQFRWQPGLLTKAVKEGHWILLEDLDYASADVITLLIVLLQERKLPGAQGTTLKVKSNFRLFSTIRVVGSDKHSELVGNCQSVEGLFSKVHVPLQSDSEIQQILVERCRDLEMFVPRIIELYRRVQDRLGKEPQCKRVVSLRDLVKLISRYAKCITGSDADRLRMFVDATDCLTSYIPCPTLRLSLAKTEIGPRFNLVGVEIEDELVERKPQISVNERQSTIGRCVVEKRTLTAYDQPITSCSDQFAQTRVSLVMLEKIARCVHFREPVLLVGETGTGKTTVVQHLAELANCQLRVINLSQQTDMVDLVGGFKPVPMRRSIAKLIDELRDLLSIRSKLLQPNVSYLESLKMKLITKAYRGVAESIGRTCRNMYTAFKNGKIKVEADWGGKLTNLESRALAMAAQIESSQNRDPMTFAFIEGILVTSMRNGDWILLDEINLAEPEMLECLASILDGQQLIIQERGDLEPIKVHPGFRIFACMNPATDIGKRDLPVGVRNRFTELYFDEISAVPDLNILTRQYLRGVNTVIIGKCVDLFTTLKQLSKDKLFDATGHRPHFCLRTFCRALRFAAQKIQEGNSAPRSVYEGFGLSFLTQVDAASHLAVEAAIGAATLGKNAPSVLAEQMRSPPGDKFVNFQKYWVPRGDEAIQTPSDYILTPTVLKNLRDLARAVSARRHPILLQGGTSLGKTSMISYMAKCTGNKCVRVNNHEHTDIAEYVGQYMTDFDGALVFKEGILVEAMRKGYWIILDELNLACSEILEALNRVLDDNRKLFIPETQIEIEAHENFIVFATQNPPGTYAGRKILSRAFRNRFIELHFNELPRDELKQILSEKCELSPAHSAKMVEVMVELQLVRKGSGVFSGKEGFITLRDLFKWAERHRRIANEGFRDWDQLLAEEGYMLLAGRIRKAEDEEHIIRALKKAFKRDVDPECIWKSSITTLKVRLMLERWSDNFSVKQKKELSHLVMTAQMRRLAILVGQALQFDEPVLIVGETGSGKTTIVQLFAQILKKRLFTVSCHQHSEASDFLGGLRPCRSSREDGRLFEWNDGPLIKAMASGDFFLADEISLADDSVLERLNSLLEAEKTIFLAEKGEGESFTATEGFWFVATMNPGGDFGKKELSPALRNRFTEIWCPFDPNDPELIDVVSNNLAKTEGFEDVAKYICQFSRHIYEGEFGVKSVVSLRDIMAWVKFVNTYRPRLGLRTAFVHGGVMTFLDPIGTGLTSSEQRDEIREIRQNGYKCLTAMASSFDLIVPGDRCIGVYFNPESICVMPYELRRKVPMISEGPQGFHFSVQTTCDNLMRLVRGLGLGRPLLLEGSPGVGKTSLVVALSKQYGVEITRINLSEQTDISDLFGADLPVEGGTGGQFQWRDGPFLRALKMGHWILLDELNLASQSVLEGLNACLDHRGEIFIPELNQSFKVARGSTEIFACQNPQRQGGGRKGLPKSFLNRFTQVHVDPLSDDDLRSILSSLFPSLSEDQVQLMVELNSRIVHEIEQGLWGQSGSPWEFNLRDLCRWAELAQTKQDFVQSAQFIYGDRMRTRDDKNRVSELIKEVFRTDSERPFPKFGITSSTVQVGDVFLDRDPRPGTFEYPTTGVGNLRLLHAQRDAMHSVMSCLSQGMLCIVVGESGCGKTSVIRQVAALTGRKLVSLPISSEMDTIELLGGFEQMDLERDLGRLIDRCCERARALVSRLAREKKSTEVESISKSMHILQNFDLKSEDPAITDVFLAKIAFLRENLSTWESSEFVIELDEVSRKYSSLSARGNFTWCDSALVRAIQEGEWILAENVNFCAPSVLDRLNSLLEKNGSLSITEQGVQDGNLRTLRPHANFRLIMTMNPKHGEISRAMRNRGHEIFMLPLDETIDAHDMKALIEARGCLDERICDKLWCVFDELKPFRSSSLVNSILKAVDYMEDEAGRGGPAVDTLRRYLSQSFESSINGEVDVELVLRTALQGLEQPSGSQQTASVHNFASGTILAEHFEDSAILTGLSDQLQSDDHEIQMVKKAMIIFLFCENFRLADDSLKLAMIESEPLRRAVESVVHSFVPRVPNYPKHLPIDYRFNMELARSLNVENHFANTFMFALFETIAANTYLQPVALQSSRDGGQACDTYISVSGKQSNLHPHAMVRQLPKLFEVIEKFFEELTSSPMSDEQLFAAKRSIYAIWRYGQSANSPVRNVEVDIRRIAIMYIWAMKRMKLVSTERTTPLLMELTEQLEKCVPALFSRARKIRKRAVQCVGTAKVFRNRESAELFQRAIALRTRAERASDQMAMQLSDEGLAVVTCAVTELEKLTNQILPLVDCVTHDLLENGITSSTRRCELIDFEEQLGDFLKGLHRYDENYVYRMSYDHEQELNKHLQPLKDVLRLRSKLAACEDGLGAEFMSKFVDLARASWNCLNDLQSKLEWRPPHIMLTLDSAKDFFSVPEAERRRHSSALVFDSSAIVSCLGSLVDSETNAAGNLHLDYSQTKLKELEEIRRLLWNQASVDSKLSTKTLRILTEVFQSVRGVVAENRSSLTAELRSAFSEAEAAAACFDNTTDSVKFEDHIFRIRVAHFLLLLFTPYDTMDPYEKVLMKKTYLSSERQHLLLELDLRVWLQKRRTGSADLDPHPMHSSNTETCENIALKIRDLDERSAYRPEPSQYGDMAKTAQSYVENIATHEKVSYFLDAISMGDDVDAELDTWLTNQKEFISRIRLTYPLYRDITMAFLFGAAQLVIAFESFYHYTKCRKIRGNLGDLIRFPRMPSSMQTETHLATVSHLISVRPNSRGTAEEDLRLQWSLKMRECKAELLEILDAIRTSSGIQEKLLEKADRILAWFSSQYVEFTEQEAERALTKDSLYEIRTIDFKGEERDEVLDARAIAALFPNFEECYEDITDERDFLNKEKQVEKQQSLAEDTDFRKFTDDDLSFLHRVFLEIVASATANCRTGPSDIVSSLLERFRLFQELRPDFKTSLSIKVDDDSYPSYLLAAAYTGWTIAGDDQKLDRFVRLGTRRNKGLRDFYNDSNIAELVKCQPVVHQIVDHCKQLLGDFENHHGLVQTLRVSYRVLSLPVTSSLMKVLTGLMKLLTELEEWNKNAHRGIKMAAETECLAQLITSWRKLELQSWSGLLEAAVDKRRIEATKFWLRLQHALSKGSSTKKGSSAFDSDEGTVKASVKELISALVNLMEVTTTVGDYEHKLQMLSDLASYVKMRNAAGDVRIHAVIMNAYCFYRQFLPKISAKIESTKAEIDKEIKDFIKIVRYKDTSFLAVQQSADKSHKKLHGCLKNFEKVLTEPSTTYIEQTPEEPPVTAVVRKGKRKIKNVDTTDFDIANYNIKTVPLKVVSEEMDTLSNIPRLHRLSRSYLQEVSQRLCAQPMSNVLDELAGDIADGVSKFAKETEKQIRHDDKDAKRKAKNLLQRKKKMLSELFRELTKCGISYRKGVAFYQKSSFFELLSTKLIRSSEVPTVAAHLVDDIERYFVRSVQKFRDLQKAMQSPSKELELYMIERLQGFGTHLFETILSESNELHDVCQASRQLRKKLSTLRQAVSFETIPEQKSNSKKKAEVHSMIFKLSFCLHQFLALLETLPTAGKDSPALVRENRLDPTMTAFTKIIERLDAKLRALDEIKSIPLSESDLNTINESVDSLKVILGDAQGAIGLLETDHRRNCITQPYYQLKEEIEHQLVRVDSLNLCEDSIPCSETEAARLERCIRRCLKRTLHSVQDLRKTFEGQLVPDSEDLINDSVKLLENEQNQVFSKLDIKSVLTSFEQVEKRLASLRNRIPSGNLSSFVGFMRNFSSHFEYFVACALKSQRAKLKLLYIVLSVSVTLTQKGFCIPEEFRDELTKDGATQLQDIEDGGLGDGEGQKDKSDKVDCEDQLEDTHHPGKEKQEEQEEDQKDIEDEKDGIEMSEDFDAKAQGPDEKEEEEEDQNEDKDEDDDEKDDDLDEQMGDVDDVDPFDLDKEMWDKDEDEEQNMDSDDDAQGGEELEEESQVVAKDDRVKNSEKDQEQNDDKENEKPNDDENPEDKINEMDDEYEGEREDPYKNNKEKGMDEEDEVEDFELPDQQMEDEENAESSGDEAGDAMDDDGEEESDAEGDTEFPADEAMPEELQEEAMEQDTADVEATAPEDDEETAQDQEADQPEEASEHPEVSKPNADEHQPQVEQAEGAKSSAESALDENQNLAESAQTNDDIDGTGDGQSSATDSGGLGKKSKAREQSMNEEGKSRENEKKQSSKDRKTAAQKPKDSKAVKGDISDATERKQAGDETSDKFEHQKDSEVDAENEEVAADMATDDQAEKTQKMAINDEDADGAESDVEDIAAHEDEPMEVDDDETEKKEAVTNRQRQERKENAKSSKGEHGEKTEVVPKEGERIATQTVAADDQSHLNTVHSLERYFEANDLDYFKASTWDRLSGIPSEVVTWAQAEFRVKKLVQELCEELRLVLEPTKVAKLRGDYRTGKRLNMRKVVDYVASGFRKDKIWLRRTQPNKREYQILLAMDDSLSMSDSFAKDRAFDTMVLLTKSLGLLEVGEIGVASFGEDVSLIHPLGEPISADTGPKLARHFTFAQKATRVAKLVSLATDMFEKSRSSMSGSSIRKDFAQLLIIVSDGRNIFAEGKNAVHATVQKARENGIFVVYIIIDNAEQNKASILNIQAVSFKNGKAITTRYLESFPFPFYIILQNVDRLPNVLGQALRQWFELVMGK